jgi:peptidoglycan/LPS O-acetylase OafA/YrhL
MGLIRLLLALSVLISHSFPLFGNSLIGSTLAVRAFFVISGFYMALILNEKYIKKNGSYRLFITNRLFRIYPIYYVLLIATIIISYVFLNLHLYAGSLTYYINIIRPNAHTMFLYGSPLDILRDFTILFRFDYFTLNPNNNEFLFLPQAWTLVMELLFYLVAPFIARKNIKLISILIFLSIIVRFLVFHYLLLNHLPITDRFFPAEIVFFLLGVISYKIYAKVKKININRYFSSLVLLGLLFFTLFYNFIPFEIQLRWIDLKAWIYLGLLMLSIPILFKITNKHWLDKLLGNLSYPVYISHLSILMILINLNLVNLKSSNFTLLLLVSTLIFSEALVIFIEKPIDT